MIKDKKSVAIVLSAGSGKRMNSDIPKQYLMLDGKPVIYYALKTFEDSFIDEIILVCGKGDIEFCSREIVDKYSFRKVKHIVEGGAERYDSVWNGICADNDAEYVFIHDGARPFVSAEILERGYEKVKACGACVVGVPVKDTVKIVNDKGIVIDTPNRKEVYQIQTPQIFRKSLIEEAYAKLYSLSEQEIEDAAITDDSMLIETFTDSKVSIVMGDYCNFKITTAEDMLLAKEFVNRG